MDEFGGVVGEIRVVTETNCSGMVRSSEGEDSLSLRTSEGGKMLNGSEMAGSTGIVREMGEGRERGIARCVFSPDIGEALDDKRAKGEFE